MALKYMVATLDGLDDGVKALYVPQDGKFVLGVEGVVPKDRLDEFRNNNLNLQTQLEAVNGKFKDIDPELYRTLAAEHQKNKDKKLIDEGKVDELVEDRVKTLRTTLEGERDGYKSQVTATRARLETLLIDNEVARYALESGCVDTALDDIVMRARTQFKLDKDDKAVAMDGEKVIYGSDGSAPMTIKEWMTTLVARAPHLFKQASGGGAGGSGNGGGNHGSFKSKADFKTVEEKSAFIKEHGREAFAALPLAR